MYIDPKHSKKIYFILVALFIILYIVPLGVRPLFTPDETRYAEIPREILQNNDWVVPRLGGLRYFEKPIMGYWLNAISQAIFGENNFAVRFASAFTTIIAALMLFAFIKKFKGVTDAVYTTMIFLTSVLVYFIGTFAVLDPHTSMFMAGSLFTFFLAYKAEKKGEQIAWLALFGAFCGATFLTKGFIAFVVPGVTIAPFLAWEKRWKEMLWMPWIPFITAVLVILPWGIMIHQREPDFWHYFVIVEHWERFFKDNSSQHPEPFWFFIPVIIGGTMPWTALVPGICTTLKKKMPQDSLFRYAICWLVFPFLFFSASSGKLGTYILPCYPALAYLIYVGAKQYFNNGNMKVLDWTCRVLYIIFIIGIVGFVLMQILGETGITASIISKFTDKQDIQTMVYTSSERWKWIVAGIAILTWIGCLYMVTKTTDIQKKFILFFCGPLLVMFVSHFLAPQMVIWRKAPGPFLEKHAKHVTPEDTVVAYKNVFAAVCWYYKRDNVYVFHKGGELSYGLEYPDTKHRLISVEHFKEMTQDPKYKDKLDFIMRSKRFREMIPKGKFEVYDKNKDKIMFSTY